MSVLMIEELLALQGVRVLCRTLHRFAVERCGFGTGGGTTVHVADGEPGVECQLDFGQMGLLVNPDPSPRTSHVVRPEGLEPPTNRVHRGVSGGSWSAALSTRPGSVNAA